MLRCWENRHLIPVFILIRNISQRLDRNTVIIIFYDYDLFASGFRSSGRATSLDNVILSFSRFLASIVNTVESTQ
jgi:hypothetical protein